MFVNSQNSFHSLLKEEGKKHIMTLIHSHFIRSSHEKLTIALLCVNDNNAQDVNEKKRQREKGKKDGWR